MSDLAMLFNDVGLEAFIEPEAVSTYESQVIDVAELVAEETAVKDSLVSLTENRERVTALVDIVGYAEDSRETMSESVARELQSRVIAVLGEERTTLVMGSMESYNGPLADQILNAGLETIGGMIVAGVKTLWRIIRNAVLILVRFFTSARVVLGKQIKATSELAREIKSRPSDKWVDRPLQFTGADIAALRETPAGDVDKLDMEADTKGKVTLTRRDAIALTYLDSRGEITFPVDVSSALRVTAAVIHDHILNVATVSNAKMKNMLGVLNSPSVAYDATLSMSRVDHRLVGYGFGDSLNLDKLTLATKESNKDVAVYYTKPILGALKMRLEIPTLVRDGASGWNASRAKEYLAGYSKVAIRLARDPAIRRIDDLVVPPAKQADAVGALAVLNTFLDMIINTNVVSETKALADQLEKMMSSDTFVIKADLDNKELVAYLPQMLSELIRISNETPRLCIAYANNLSNATRRYIEASAGL